MSFRSLSFFIPAALAVGLHAQTAVTTCQTSAVPTTVRAEGIAERTGDILLSCSGGPGGTSVSGNIIVFLSVNVTNRVLGDGTTDVVLNVDNGSGVTTYTARPYQVNAVAFNGVIFNTSPQGTVDLRIVNLRANASLLGFLPNQSINANLSFTGVGIAVQGSTFTVAWTQRGLYAISTGHLICDQYGSPLPDTINFTTLLGTSAFSTTRITEGFASSFAPLSDPSNLRADTGVRIIARYSGFTAGARLFVPDAIAGGDADIPTSAGDLGLAASGGRYTPGKIELLLVRVTGADSTGAGGTLVIPAPAVQTSFNSVSEIALTGGSGYAVWEVVDANPFAVESAQFPTFLGLAPSSGASAVETGFGITFAPVSTVTMQSASAPIPRYIDTPPPADCSITNDCSAGYFPSISIDTTPIQFLAAAGQPATRYVPIRNDGGGVLRWTATVAYATGSNWLRLSPPQGVNNSTLRVDAVTTSLAPGTYQATITIDAGPAVGTRTIPVTLTVTPASAAPPTVSIRTVTNAAGADQTSLVAGSLATIMGTNFAANGLQVTFDGTPATVLFSNATQINLQVPAALAGKLTAQLIVSVAGNAAPPVTVNLAFAAPAIFPSAVLNQDNSVNGESSSAPAGSIVQVFATGLPANGVITAKIHDRLVPVPQYGGPAPGLTGVQQVNIQIPADLPTMQTWVYVCGGTAPDQQVCSAPAKIWLQQQ